MLESQVLEMRNRHSRGFACKTLAGFVHRRGAPLVGVVFIVCEGEDQMLAHKPNWRKMQSCENCEQLSRGWRVIGKRQSCSLSEPAVRYSCRTPHFHMCSDYTDHAARMHVYIWFKGHEGSSLSCVPKIGHSSTRHVSPCASQYTEHQHKFSLTYLSCVTVVLCSESRPVVHASTYPV